jgi:hypothetical protein
MGYATMELLDLLVQPALAQAASEPASSSSDLNIYLSSKYFPIDMALIVIILILFKVFARWPRYERWLVAGTLIAFALYPAIVGPTLHGGSFSEHLLGTFWFLWLIPVGLLGLWIFLKFNTSLLASPTPAPRMPVAAKPERASARANPEVTEAAPEFAKRKPTPDVTSRKPDPDPWPPTVPAAAAIEKIFLSYRRDDSADATGRIYDRLVQRFGKEQIFKDVDSIPLGVDFREHLGNVVGRCNLVLVVIGDRWIDAGSAGARRLDDAADFVRIEIESALERKIPVVPVLVRGATLPADSALPPSLRALAYRNGMSVRPDPDFHRDMDRLIAGLETHLAR